MRGIIVTALTVLLLTPTACTLLSISEADDSESETAGPGELPPRTDADGSDDGEPALGWCCACGINVGDALACTPSTVADCEGEDMTWCELDAQADTSACQTACTECVCDCEQGASPGCTEYDQMTACASECDLVWCCACEDLGDDYIGPYYCDVVPAGECMDPGEASCSPDGIFVDENPVLDCWQQCQPEQFGWCCECAGLEQSPNCTPSNFFNCADPGWAWCDELDDEGQLTPCVEACADLSGWCCDCGLGQQGWWECKQSDPQTCTGEFEAWCSLAPCIEACGI